MKIPVMFIRGTVFALAIALVAAGLVLADDGPMVRKDIAKTPDLESDHAQLSMMQFYVPATRASGALVGSTYDTNPPPSGELEYYADRDGDNQPDELLFTRGYAKPLVVTYQDEEPTGAAAYDVLTGEEVGIDIRRDTFAAISLDDGETWKETNLSESAIASSFDVTVRDANGNEIGTAPYPGDVTEIVHAVAGNQILVAWTSKYCDQGSPRYSLKDFDGDGFADSSADFPGVEGVPLYEDIFGVAGNQGSIDYYDWMHHGQYPFREIGEVPFSCVWTARGTIEYLPAGQGSELYGQDVWGVRWRKAERLTSGRRDAYKLAIDGVEGAGFALAWQEDPEGLRPGYGEGPGVGWSGATVNHKADIWYSYIDWDDFTLVEDPTTPGVPAVDPDLLDTGKPKVFEHMTMPVRMTDNEKCELEDDQPKVNAAGEITMPWCYDLDIGNGTRAGMGTPDGTGDLCPVRWTDQNSDGLRQPGEYTIVDTNRIVQWTNSRGITMDICISDDGRMLNGQTGSSRARLMMEGYTKPDGTKSAWVAVMYEESKGLGAGHVEDVEALDIGKDAMYHTFDMFQPDLAAAGHMLNMPETADETLAAEYGVAVGDFLPLIPNDLSVALAGGDATAATPNQYNTPIARRGSFMLQPSARIAERVAAGSAEGMTSGIFLYKSGADRQGGPADIFMRRTVLPAGFDSTTDNPYAVENLYCEGYSTVATSVNGWETYPETSYPNGLCVNDGAANLSSMTPLTFEPLGNEEQDPSHGILDRVLTWEQTELNLLDEQWTSKYDVAKGHRGFIDGDFVMVLYGYSPNWLATSKGHEPYNLYIRRSFDGGVTWTTTPASLGGDGTTYDQVNGVGDRVWTETRTLAAGEFEPARNVSQLTSSKETVLAPRYSPTNMGTQTDVNRILNADGTYTLLSTDHPLYDMRDPSKFTAVYETGDATVVLTAGEADPWDLFASRATNYGDDWDAEDVYAQGRGIWEERWDWIENKDETMSGESSIAMSPDGQFAWIVWNEWIQHETDVNGDGLEDVTEADPMFRRLWWDDNEDPVADAGGPYETTESSTATTLVTLTGSANDPAGDEIVSYAWDLDSDGVFETDGQQVNFMATGAPQAVALRVCDSRGFCDVDATWVNRPNPHTPRVWRIRPEINPVMVGSTVNVTAKFNAPGTSAISSVVWDWGDGVTEPGILPAEMQGTGSSFATGSHSYAQAGVYPVTLTVTNAEGLVGFDTEYVAIYDPNAGFITGEGWFTSPAGSLIGNDQEQRLTFQFDAQYDRNAGYLKGQVALSLDTQGMTFASTGLDWLAIEPDGMSHLKGVGSLNGTGGYEFLLTVRDGGKKGTDLARVRIWHTGASKNGHVVYDSQLGSHIGADAVQALGGGNVTLHTIKARDDGSEQTEMSGGSMLYLPAINKD